jgi:YgiT-type zinc finger domain-containing protein
MDQPPPMESCTQCGSNDLHVRIVRSAFWHEDRLVVVDDIPAIVCEACHEQFYDDGVAVQIDRLRGTGFPPDLAHGELRALVFSLRDRPEAEAEP